MPFRTLVTKELAELFGVLSHPVRIRILEELHHSSEMDVSSLAEVLQISHSGVSQHLALLRSHRLIVERKQGRSVYYHLRQQSVAPWVIEGLKYAGPHQSDPEEFKTAVEHVRALWFDGVMKDPGN